MKPTEEHVIALAEANCLYVTPETTGSDVYHAAQEILPPEVWCVSGWAIIGQLDSLEWCVCDTCREIKLMAPRKVKCPMSTTRQSALMPDCPGHMERIAARPRMTKKLKARLFL